VQFNINYRHRNYIDCKQRATSAVDEKYCREMQPGDRSSQAGREVTANKDTNDKRTADQ